MKVFRVIFGFIVAFVFLGIAFMWIFNIPQNRNEVFGPVADRVIGLAFLLLAIIETCKTVNVLTAKESPQ